MTGKSLKMLGLSLLLIFSLIGAFAFPAYAASQVWMSVIGLAPGSQVQLEIVNLPAYTEFTVRMGPAGSKGIGAPVVAHFNSQEGGNISRWFEIHATISKDPFFDVRIENSTGTAAYVTVNNTIRLPLPTSSVTVTVTPAAAPLAGNVTVRQVGGIKVVHVQRDGIVVAAIRNMPANTVFTTTVGVAGSKGLGGYPVGSLTTSNTSGLAMVGTFEIPSPLWGAHFLDLRVEAPGYVYYATFRNIDY